MRIVRWWDLLVLYEGEHKTAREAVEAAVRTGANLRDANLYAADLRGADLRDANLREANLCGADLREANLYAANLYAANLCGADLCGAHLRGANLRDANLCGAKIEAGTVSCVVAMGSLRNHAWIAYHMEDESVRLKYGCEEHAVAEWPGLLRGLCLKYEWDRADDYEAAIAALLVHIEAVVRIDAERGSRC
jgi:hypothetical protein